MTFASAGAAFTVLPWLLYENIKAHGVDVFTDTAEVSQVNKLNNSTKPNNLSTVALLLQIMLANDTDDAVYDLESGRTDATLLRADALAHMEERGIINASSFKSLGSVSANGSARLTNVSILLQHVTRVFTPFAGSTAWVSISSQHQPHT